MLRKSAFSKFEQEFLIAWKKRNRFAWHISIFGLYLAFLEISFRSLFVIWYLASPFFEASVFQRFKQTKNRFSHQLIRILASPRQPTHYIIKFGSKQAMNCKCWWFLSIASISTAKAITFLFPALFCNRTLDRCNLKIMFGEQDFTKKEANVLFNKKNFYLQSVTQICTS